VCCRFYGVKTRENRQAYIPQRLPCYIVEEVLGKCQVCSETSLLRSSVRGSGQSHWKGSASFLEGWREFSYFTAVNIIHSRLYISIGISNKGIKVLLGNGHGDSNTWLTFSWVTFSGIRFTTKVNEWHSVQQRRIDRNCFSGFKLLNKSLNNYCLMYT